MHPMSKYPPRPQVTAEMRAAAAKSIEVRMGSAYEGLADTLSEIDSEHMDGYELCKELETRYYFDGCMQLCEELDNYGSMVRRLREAAEKSWATENNVQPPFPIGMSITAGVIDSVYEHGAAEYLVNFGHADRKRVIRFEDAHPIKVLA